MKKYLLFLLFIQFTLPGCYNYHYVHYARYNFELNSVEKPKDKNQIYANVKIQNFEENGTQIYLYEDEIIKIVWNIDNETFNFILNNLSDKTLKILWDDAGYVNTNGFTERLIHSGIQYINRNNPQPPTIIPVSYTHLTLPTIYSV